MNLKTTIVLFVLLVAGLGVLAYYHWSGHTEPSEGAGQNYVIKGLGEIQKLQLEGRGTPAIVLERKDDKKWYLTSPVSAPAAENQAARTVANVTVMVYDHKFGPKDADRPGDDLTGLSSPERVVTVTDERGKSATVRVGKNRPLSTQSYVQVVGDPNIYMTALNLTELLAKTPDDFRDPAIFDFEPASVDRVEARGATNFVLQRAAQRWLLESPIQGRANQEKARDFVQSLAALRAERFVNDAPSPADLKGYGLDNPRLMLTVEIVEPRARPTSRTAVQATSTASTAPSTQPASAPASAPASKPAGKSMTIVFGAASGGRTFAKLADQPWVFQVGLSKLDDLQPKADALRDRHVLDLANKMPMEAEIVLAHGQSVKLERGEAGQWQMVEPFAGPAEQTAVMKLFSTLFELQASEFVEPTTFAPLGLDPPNGKIVLQFKDGEPPAVLLLGGTTGESGQAGFVREEGSPSVAVVVSNDFATLNRPAPAYWPLRLFEVSPLADFAWIRIEKPDAPAVEIQRFARDDFRMVEPLSGPADVESLRALLESLREFKSSKIISLDNALPERFAKLKPIRVTTATMLVSPPSATQPATAPASTPATTSAPSGEPTSMAASAPAIQPTTASAPATAPAQMPQPAILIVKDGNTAYAWIEGRKPVAVGEISPQMYDHFDAEFRSRMVFPIDPSKAISLKVSLEKNSMEFVRSGDTWRYSDDPFLKVEQERIKSYLFDLARLKAKRYVDYAKPTDLQRFGLDSPTMTVEVKYDTGEPMKLSFSRTGPVGVDGLYGLSSMVDGVFVLAPDSPRKMQDSLQSLKTPAATPTPAPREPAAESPTMESPE